MVAEERDSIARDEKRLMTADSRLGTPGPFEVHSELLEESPLNTDKSNTSSQPTSVDEVPRRYYDCSNYERCLGLAASLNWESFTCNGCNGEINETLTWRAHLSARKDSVAKHLFQAPPITTYAKNDSSPDKVEVVA